MPLKTNGVPFEIHPSPMKGSDGRNIVYVRPQSGRKITMEQVDEYCAEYGLTDEYQQNTSFARDSYSIGLGCAVKLTEKIRLNAGYFITIYEDYTKTYTAAQGGYMGTGYPGSETFSRANHVIGVGVDFKFCLQ